MTLDLTQLRVLGALIEKEISTPEAYPLSLNALVNACNQRSSREPVMDLGEEEVRQGLHGLEDKALVSVVREARVAKFEHRARTVLNLRRDETAVLCLLLLRGPQTPGELRSRADRLYTFDGLEAVEGTLNRLAGRGDDEAAGGPLTVLLPRQPGAREARWAHLLGGPLDVTAPRPSGAAETDRRPADTGAAAEMLARISAVELELARLRDLVASLETKLHDRQGSPGAISAS